MTDKLPKKEVRRLRGNLQDEVDASTLYNVLADNEKDSERSGIFRALAEVEGKHAEIWRKKLEEVGEKGEAKPSRRARFLMRTARLLGARSLLPVVTAMEMKASSGLSKQPAGETSTMVRQEQMHARVFSELSKGGKSVAQLEPWHRGAGGGSLRAAVFGVNDGLVSNFSLLMGVAGGTSDRSMILLAGIAGMLAGAFSMAAGEYVSMKSQRELFEWEIQKEADELEEHPEIEAQELALIYRAKGIPEEQAVALAATLMADRETALDTLVREELGLDPSELGSPWGAAFSSFFAFVGGAIVPLFPFFFSGPPTGVWISAGLSAAALFAVGSLLSIFTGRSALLSGLRMLGIGCGVALVTNVLGRLIGISLA